MRALWIWLITCLALASAGHVGPPPDKDDPNVLQLPSSLIDDATREKILKPCDDPLVRTVNQDPKAVWQGLGCFELHGTLDYEWYINGTSNISYSEFISDKMHGPPNWRCRDMFNSACNTAIVQCHQTEFACGHLILNSFANVHSMYYHGYTALLSAHDRDQDDVMSFVDIFAPELDVFPWGDLVIPLITLGVGVIGEVSGRILKRVVEHVKDIEKKNKDRKGKGKEPTTTRTGDTETETGEAGDDLDKKYNSTVDVVKNGIVQTAGMAMPYGLIHLPAVLDGDTTDAKVFSLLGQIYDQLTNMQVKQVDDLFNGSTPSMQALWRTINDGTFTNFDGNNTLLGFHEEVKKMYFAALIPNTWRVAPGFEADRNGPEYTLYSTPMFLKSGKKCGEEPPKSISKYDDLSEICYEGEQWYMVVVEANFGGEYVFHPKEWSFGLKKLPGTEVLVSEEGFLGIKATDLLISALSAYERSGKQFWSPSPDELVVKTDGSGFGLQFTNGLHSPGLVQMQVCTDWERLAKLLDNYGKDGSAFDEIDKKEWPCGTIDLLCTGLDQAGSVVTLPDCPLL